MDDQFPVNAGNVAPPSQASNQVHQVNTFQPMRRKVKEAMRPISKVIYKKK